MKRLLLALPLLLTTVSCGASPTPAAAPLPTAAASPSATPVPSPEPVPATAEELVHGDSAALMSARVSRSGASTEVTSLWRVDGPGPRYVVARSDDGFATGTWERVSQRVGLAAVSTRPDGAPRFGDCVPVTGGTTLCTDADGRLTWTDGTGAWSSTPVSDLNGFGQLLVDPVGSLAPDTFAAVGGGDGATLFPFDRVARSRDGGTTWATTQLPTFDGESAYVTGHVVLPDGRLVAALTHVGDDRRNRPADRPHGLWISDGEDWSSLTPYAPRFVPALPPTDGYGPIASLGVSIDPDPLVLVTLGDGRVFASPDGVRPFREVAVR